MNRPFFLAIGSLAFVLTVSSSHALGLQDLLVNPFDVGRGPLAQLSKEPAAPQLVSFMQDLRPRSASGPSSTAPRRNRLERRVTKGTREGTMTGIPVSTPSTDTQPFLGHFEPVANVAPLSIETAEENDDG